MIYYIYYLQIDPIKSQPNVGKYTIISASFFFWLLSANYVNELKKVGGTYRWSFQWTDRSSKPNPSVIPPMGDCWVGTVIEKKMANCPYILVDMDPLRIPTKMVLASHLFWPCTSMTCLIISVFSSGGMIQGSGTAEDFCVCLGALSLGFLRKHIAEKLRKNMSKPNACMAHLVDTQQNVWSISSS